MHFNSFKLSGFGSTARFIRVCEAGKQSPKMIAKLQPAFKLVRLND